MKKITLEFEPGAVQSLCEWCDYNRKCKYRDWSVATPVTGCSAFRKKQDSEEANGERH